MHTSAKWIMPVIVAVPLVIGCTPTWHEPSYGLSVLSELDPVETVWVSQAFKGGVQCDDVREYPPDTLRYFNAAGIAVYDFIEIGLFLTRSCGYPEYNVRHELLISVSDLSFVEGIGFEERGE